MDDCFLLVSLRPVDVGDGFQAGFGSHTGDILIKKDGRKCKHFFISRDTISNNRDYEKVMREAFSDFVKTARVGSGLRSDYVRDYCKGMAAEDIAEAWGEYRSATNKLEKLLGCNPSEFLQNIFHT